MIPTFSGLLHGPARPRLRVLKGAAQLLKPLLEVGRAGMTPAFIAALDEALRAHELVKIRFTEHKTEKQQLAPVLAEATHSRLIMLVGNVAVYYRPPRAKAWVRSNC